MRAVSGIFTRLSKGVDAAERLGPLVGVDNVNLLTPMPGGERPGEVPTTEDMPPVGGAMGGVIGGALGVATAMAIPGIGQVVVLGMAAAALLGAGGGVIGWTLGDAIDRASSAGLPVDELYVYENATRPGADGGHRPGRRQGEGEGGARDPRRGRRGEPGRGSTSLVGWAARRGEGALRCPGRRVRARRESFSKRVRGGSFGANARQELCRIATVSARPASRRVRDAPFRRGFERGKKYLAARRARATTRPPSAVPFFSSAV